MSEEKVVKCKYCGQEMLKWEAPDDMGWESDFLYVCFNDDCEYFKNGWEWMWTKYEVRASYRYRIDPKTGMEGPLPVWSNEALRSRILNK